MLARLGSKDSPALGFGMKLSHLVCQIGYNYLPIKSVKIEVPLKFLKIATISLIPTLR